MSILEASFIKKYNKKTVPQLLKLLTEKFNRFIRNRDTDEFDCITCISCNKTYPSKGMHAGHYFASTFSILRFHENNVHGQCVRCNMHLHGNLISYRQNLIKKIGIEEVERLEQISKIPYKWDRFSLIDLILKYK